LDKKKAIIEEIPHAEAQRTRRRGKGKGKKGKEEKLKQKNLWQLPILRKWRR
jgi:3-polyprenyl-4-hydroxybenzoate decarboxylase